MNTRDILMFVTGALVGAGATFFGVKKFYSKKLDEKTQAFEDRMAYYEQFLAPVENTEQESDEVKNANGTALPPKVNISYTDYAAPYSVTNYNNPSDEPKPSSQNYKTFEGALKVGMITEDEFQQSDFNCTEYVWTRDGKLIDEQYHIVEKPEKSIGFDTLEYIQEHPDEEEFYARNERIELDIVITREDYTAEEYIHTFDPTGVIGNGVVR